LAKYSPQKDGEAKIHNYIACSTASNVSVLTSPISGRADKKYDILNSMGAGILYPSELLGFWTFPSSGILGTRKHYVSETGSVSVVRCGVKTPTQMDPLDRANLNH
jgi:hypothetical protein